MTREGEHEYLRLTAEVIDDELFWWWAITQPPSMGVLFLVTLADFDWVSFFQHAYIEKLFRLAIDHAVVRPELHPFALFQ